jgi:hypothetical protein
MHPRTWTLPLLGALAFVVSGPALAQGSGAQAPPGGDPTLACGQASNGRAYWLEQGFCDIPTRGPAAAKGVVFWSHGVDGDREAYRSPPPLIMRRFANAGWDVFKINRNNLNERGWTSSGVRHRDEAIERARAARSQGYRAVVLAGQSYGGAISLEANARSTDIHGVIALSPGHGSDLGQPGGGGGGRYFNTDIYLLDAVAAQKGGRVVVLVALNDHLHPNRSTPGSYMGPRLRQALAGTGRPYVVFDETGPIHGHGAGTTNQFSDWFGACLARFLDPGQAPPPGETICPPPNPLPHFLLPTNLRQPTPGASGSALWLGAWVGGYTETRGELMVVVENVSGPNATIVYATGPGPNRDRSMGFDRYSNARIDGNRIVVDRGRGRTFELAFAADGKRADVVHKGGEQTLSGSLHRAE